MSKPQVDLVETALFSTLGERTSTLVDDNVWEYIQVRMTIRIADNAWNIADRIEDIMITRAILAGRVGPHRELK